MSYQILNNLGAVEIESVTEEELETLKENCAKDGFNYYLFDPTAENDLVTKWAQNTEIDYSRSRIIKKID
jgi:hypothetical protein